MAAHREEDRSMTPTQLEAAMRRAGVGQYENMTGTPYPYKSRLEEAEAIVAELGPSLDVRRLFRVSQKALMGGLTWAACEALAEAYAAAEPAKEGAEG